MDLRHLLEGYELKFDWQHDDPRLWTCYATGHRGGSTHFLDMLITLTEIDSLSGKMQIFEWICGLYSLRHPGISIEQRSGMAESIEDAQAAAQAGAAEILKQHLML